MKKIFVGLCAGFAAFAGFGAVTHAQEVVNTAPVINLLGASPAIVVSGDPLPNIGALVLDAEEGDITARLVVTSRALDAEAGTYLLSYTATDSQGLAAVPVERTVRFISRNAVQPISPAAPETIAVITEPTPVVLVDRASTSTDEQKDEDAVPVPTGSADLAEDIAPVGPGNMSRFAAFIFATLPQTGSDILTCVFLFLLTASLIYIGANIVANSQDLSHLTEVQIRRKKILYFIYGCVIALIAAYLFNVVYLLVPLAVLLIALVIWFVWYEKSVVSNPTS